MARVLLVDDSPTQVFSIQRLLEDESHVVTVAENGEVAMNMLTDHVPDIVVTDLQMPKVNGLELIKHLRRGYPQVPGILITAQGSEELSAEALKVGAAAYLPKSQVTEELVGTIECLRDLQAHRGDFIGDKRTQQLVALFRWQQLE